MKKLILVFLITILLLATATASMLIPANDNARENAKAPEKSPVITETETGNWELDRIDFIHYVKPESPARVPKPETCYKLLGIKWNTLPVNYIINPINPFSLSEEFIANTIKISAEAWDNIVTKELFNDVYTIDYNIKYGVQDYKNAISFDTYSDNNVIAVTSIWYTRVGKQIVEFDMLFNTKYAFGDAAINPALMDLQNIATHELGHSVGLNDLYSSACSEVTMYGYSNYGETKKRTLEQSDITGLQKIYGI